ncbi:MAG: hypothetical protein JNJ69_06875 [Leptospiraceae bacterium]|nr:hypothetical protein [Leptospiraceae bacterium]
MKKTGLVIVAAAFAIAACGGRGTAIKEYGEAFDTATKKINEVSADLKAAKDGKAVGAALNKFADTLNEMKTKGEALDKKHKLKMKGDEVPPELKPKFEAFQAAVKAMSEGPMMEAMKAHAAAPEVAEALKKIQEVSKD